MGYIVYKGDIIMKVFNQQLIQILKNPVILAVFIVWHLFWKGLALWKSASKKHLAWFIILLMVNTIGILEIAYILYLNKWSIDDGKLLAFLEKNFQKPKKL